jgi:predicted aldo/keto reductase-like oxidoreductase
MIVLSGMSDYEQLLDNTAYMRDFQRLNETEMAIIGKVKEIINANTAIPCTECRYCVDVCPAKIPIPDYFALYNDQKRFVFAPVHAAHYMDLTLKYGKPSDCISCKACEAHCPQHIAITEQMKVVSKTFENWRPA